MSGFLFFMAVVMRSLEVMKCSPSNKPFLRQMHRIFLQKRLIISNFHKEMLDKKGKKV